MTLLTAAPLALLTTTAPANACDPTAFNRRGRLGRSNPRQQMLRPRAVEQHAGSRQREEMEAQISADMLMAERSECALIWHAETQNNEIIDFRATTSAAAVLGIALRTVPRAVPPPTLPEHGHNIIVGGRR